MSQQLGNLIDYLVAPFPGNRPKDAYQILDCLAAIEKESNIHSSNHEKAPVHNTPKYAGFWKRAIAYIIDYVIIVIGAMVISGIVGSILIDLFPASMATLPSSIPKEKITTTPNSDAVMGGFFTSTCGLFGLLMVFAATDSPTYPVAKVTSILVLILQWLYFVLLESSNVQATVGKMPLQIIATDANENRLSFAQANIRYWSKNLSGLMLCIGYVVAIFTKK